MEFHISCVGLKKRPGQKTKWSCPGCKTDINSVIKTLSQTISALEQTVTELTAKQKRLDDHQNILRNENIDLKRQIADMKENVDKLSKQSAKDTQSAKNSYCHSNKTLIIGDSILRGISDSSVANAKVKPISGASVKDINDEINSMSDELSTYGNIIVHSGTNDVSRGTGIQAVTETMEAIVTNIMVNSPTSTIHISAICPRSSKTKVAEEYNQSLKDLATRLTCGYIEIGSKVTYQDGTIDTSKFVDGLHLSGSGTQVLINAFVEAVPDLKPTEGELWSTVVNRSRRKNSATNTQSTVRFTQPLLQENKIQQECDRAYQPHVNRSDHARHNHFINHQHYRESDFNIDRDYRFAEYAGCWKCGLYNHNAETCYYKSKLQCRSCKSFGHKARYCTIN